MKSVEMEGKTVDEAVFFALNALDLPIEKVDIEVLNENSKGGLFGLGAKRARVRLTEKPKAGGAATEFLEGLIEKMGIDAEVCASEDDEAVKLEMKGKDAGSLIGYRGENLYALQYLTALVYNRKGESDKRVLLDVENYREKRRVTLEALAKKMASQVRRTGRRAALEPMNPYERRILHAALQDDKYVTTISEGVEPNRRVVIIARK